MSPIPQYAASADEEYWIGQHGPLAIIGDTQRTSLQECFFMNREVNDREQKILVNALAHEDPKPSKVVHLGDTVFYGSHAWHWAYFDHLMKVMRQARLPMVPMIGNHEADWGDSVAKRKATREHIAKRWPWFKSAGPSYYSTVWNHSLALIMLDSNKESIAKSSWNWAQQEAWFKQTMQTYDADKAIRGILVFIHHAPYTNSPIVDPDLNAQDFVPTVCTSAKALAVISGHAHGYERFTGADPSARRGGRSTTIANACGASKVPFIVSGGGGGPREGYLPEQSWGLKDTATGDAAKYEKLKGIHIKVTHGRRPFNYLLISQDSPSHLTVRVRGLSKGEPHVHDLERFELPLK